MPSADPSSASQNEMPPNAGSVGSNPSVGDAPRPQASDMFVPRTDGAPELDVPMVATSCMAAPAATAGECTRGGEDAEGAFSFGLLADDVPAECLNAFVDGNEQSYFLFWIEQNSAVTISVSATVQAQLYACAPILNPNSALARSSNGLLEANLPPGAYYIGIPAAASNRRFDLDLRANRYPISEPEDEPGETVDGALSIPELIIEPFVVAGYVGPLGPLDDQDVYRLTLTADGEVVIALRDVWGAIRAELLGDAQLLEAAESLQSVSAAPEGSLTRMLSTGTYFLNVEAPNVGSIYTLSVYARPPQ
jgi:hypothetical protein